MSESNTKVDASTFAAVGGGGAGVNGAKKGKVMLGSMDEPGIYVEAQYNPKELEIQKQVPWSKVNEANKSNQKSDQGQGIHLEFTGAEGRSLSLELLFDGAEAHGPRSVNVAAQVAKLEKLASVRVAGSKKEELKRPHRCMVVWGEVVKMSCVIESVTTKYTMFDPAGQPLRATCTVKLKEADIVSAAKKGGGK